MAANAVLTLGDECPTAIVCFHGQQAAEKAIKAILTAHGIPFAKVHDLGDLRVSLPPAFVLPANATELETLTAYAVVTPYPDAGEEPGRERAEAAVQTADRIVQSAEAHLRSLLP